jgi:hypothetical protein
VGLPREQPRSTLTKYPFWWVQDFVPRNLSYRQSGGRVWSEQEALARATDQQRVVRVDKDGVTVVRPVLDASVLTQ